MKPDEKPGVKPEAGSESFPAGTNPEAFSGTNTGTNPGANPAASLGANPSLGWMLRSPARILAFGFGSGLMRPAPGTWGTAFAWVLHALALRELPVAYQVAAAILAFGAGIWACGHAGRDLGVADHGGMVLDEVAAFWLVLALVPASVTAQLAAFALFRLFDIVKPPPIRHAERRWKNGFGVMFDDLLAALYTLLVFAIWQRLPT